MTTYEWLRVILHALQLVIMIVVPFVVLKHKIKLVEWSKDDDKTDSK